MFVRDLLRPLSPRMRSRTSAALHSSGHKTEEYIRISMLSCRYNLSKVLCLKPLRGGVLAKTASGN